MEDERSIMYKLGGIEALIQSFNAKLDTFISDTKDKQDDHDKRLGLLEKGQVRVLAWASALAFAISTGIAVVEIWLK